MSGIQESIYNLIPREAEQPGPTTRYKSQYSSTVREEWDQKKLATKTMGPAKVDAGSPEHYLKKGGGPSATQPAPRVDTHKHTLSKPPVPKHDDVAVLGDHTAKNYIQENTMDILRTVPKKPEPAILDKTSGPGGRQLLENSGLVPKYAKLDTFGKVPDYLQRKKQEELQAAKDRDAHLEAISKMGAPRQLSADERQQLLDGLKANWKQLHHDYQGLSLLVDTESKKQRKKKMEEKLAQLEADIQRVESHPVIFVEE